MNFKDFHTMLDVYSRSSGIAKTHMGRALRVAFDLLVPEDGNERIANYRRIFQSEGKIPAIARYRKDTGYGLKESKDYIEGLCHDLPNGAY